MVSFLPLAGCCGDLRVNYLQAQCNSVSDSTVLSVIWIIFSGLFRLAEFSVYIDDSAETVALAITSIRCRDIAQACYYFIMPADCWSLFMREMYALWGIAAYFYRVVWFWPSGNFGAQTKFVDFSTRDVSFRLARNVLYTGYR